MESLGLSYHNTHSMHQTIDQVPTCTEWQMNYVAFPDNPEYKHLLQYCCLVKLIKSLLNNPTWSEELVFVPQKVYSDKQRSRCIYNEMWTGKWWHSVQSLLLQGAMVALVIIAMDKTQLTQFSRGKSAYPIYLTLGNIPCLVFKGPVLRLQKNLDWTGP